MKSGNKPDPLEIKKRKGAVSKSLSSILPSAAEYGGQIPTAPIDFSRELEQEWIKIWEAIKFYASPIGDSEIVRRLCELRIEAREMRKIIDAEGMLSYGYKGQPRPHPLLNPLRTLEKSILALEDRLSLNPLDRSRLGYVEVKKTSVLDELVTKRLKREIKTNSSAKKER